MTKTMTVDDVSSKLAAARRRRDDASSRCVPWGSTESKIQRTARELVLDLDEEIAALEREAQALALAERQRIIEARRPGAEAELQALLAAAEHLVTQAHRVRVFREETAALLGLAAGPPPLPGALALDAQIDQLRLQLAGPQPEVVAPVRAGRRRLRLLTNYHDREAMQYRVAGDVVDLVEADAADA